MQHDTSTLRGRVSYCLERYPETRDNDVVLTVALWRTFYSHRIQGDMVRLEDVLQLPREDQISRIRRKFQEDGFYRGSRFVEEHREVAAADAREHAAPWYARCP